jgi:hypothetical protein
MRDGKFSVTGDHNRSGGEINDENSASRPENDCCVEITCDLSEVKVEKSSSIDSETTGSSSIGCENNPDEQNTNKSIKDKDNCETKLAQCVELLTETSPITNTTDCEADSEANVSAKSPGTDVNCEYENGCEVEQVNSEVVTSTTDAAPLKGTTENGHLPTTTGEVTQPSTSVHQSTNQRGTPSVSVPRVHRPRMGSYGSPPPSSPRSRNASANQFCSLAESSAAVPDDDASKQQQYVVNVHVNPGETFSVCVSDQVQLIQGECIIARWC